MTAKDKIARRKLGLLELAKELSNVSRACRTLGYSRQQFYEIRRNFQTFGMDGLIDKLPGAKGPHPNRVAKEIEDRILKEALDHPLTEPCAWPRIWLWKEYPFPQAGFAASGSAME